MGYRTLLSGLFALGTIVCMAQTPPEQSPELKAALERIGNVMDHPNRNAYFNLTPEERGLLIEHFREQKRVAEDPYKRDGMKVSKALRANTALPLLGDPETIDAAIRAFIEQPLTQRHEQIRAAETLRLASEPTAAERR